jgi:MoaA/NifB/PqqE/SkfB family radical SAM enzyme
MTVDQYVDNITSQFNIIGIINCDNYVPSSIDLYNQIFNLHQDSYNPTDRLIFTISQDFYKKNTSAGLMLQSLQAILNDVDISNFFVCIVTTNPKIKTEYQWVLDNVSIDKVPVNIYECKGEYSALDGSTQTRYIKYQKIQDAKLINSFSKKEKELLFESDSFCIAPWVSFMIDTNSKVRPCCESTETLGDCSQNSLEEIWNSTTTKQFRKNLLQGKKLKSCHACHDKENLGRDTLRKSLNRRFANQINKIKLTDSDGFLENYSLTFLDARFNNLCNLSCRSCSPRASSSWYQPAVAIGMIDKSAKALQIAGKNSYDIFSQILEQIDNLERIYFAGGEPLMIDQFYKLVEELDQRGKHDVELIYNINMTKSSLAGKSIFDVWKNFKNISIGASLDGEYQRGEYLRCGQKWEEVVEFRKEMLAKRPDIDFYISATTSIINALHLPDFHRSWVEQGLIKPEDFNIQVLYFPNYLRVDRAPDYLKDLIRKKYQTHIEWLQPQDSNGRAVYGFNSILNLMDNNNNFDSKDFWENIISLDNYYNQNLLDVFPELSDLPTN